MCSGPLLGASPCPRCLSLSPLPAAMGWVPPGCFVSPGVPHASFFSLV